MSSLLRQAALQSIIFDDIPYMANIVVLIGGNCSLSFVRLPVIICGTKHKYGQTVHGQLRTVLDPDRLLGCPRWG
jgi:hypothetical protein